MSKICFIANLFPSKRDPSFGSFVGKNHEQLIEQGHKIINKVVIDYRASGLEKLICYIRFIFSGMLAINKRNYDFIYFHYLTYSTICLLPYLLFSKPKYVINVHGDDLVGNSFIHKIMGIASPLIIKHSAGIIVPSQYFKTILLELYPWYREEKVIISPSGGVDFEIFKANKLSDSSLFTLGYVSRIDEGKGWPELLKAVALIKNEQPELVERFKLNLYGTGGQVEQLKNEISELGIGKLVTYFGALEHNQLAIKYSEMNAFVFPTHRESFGLVAVEALACGTPVLASNISPVNEIVIEGINGLFFEKQNPHSIAKKIIQLLEMKKADYDKLVSNARESVEHYSAELVAKQLDENLQKLINN